MFDRLVDWSGFAACGFPDDRAQDPDLLACCGVVAGFRPPRRRASHFLCLSKESNQRNDTPKSAPCGHPAHRVRVRDAGPVEGTSLCPRPDRRHPCRRPTGFAVRLIRPPPAATTGPRKSSGHPARMGYVAVVARTILPRSVMGADVASLHPRKSYWTVPIELMPAHPQQFASALAARKAAKRGPCGAAGGGRISRCTAASGVMDDADRSTAPGMARCAGPAVARVPGGQDARKACRRGVLSFGYFSLDKQRKATRPPPRRTKPGDNTPTGKKTCPVANNQVHHPR